ncbi:MAG: tetratricopeptide repeat protein [Bacteroidetes bacterium]|nr:tetratricopeptide repeat protein [Bacteroidota bacterium]
MKNISENRIESLKSFLKENPEDLFSQYAMALEYLHQDHVAVAVEILKRVLEQDKNYLAAYYQLGKAYEAMSSVDAAKQVYADGIRIAELQNNKRTLNELRGALETLIEDE